MAAPEPVKIYSFQEWKRSQVVEAKNQVARLSNRLTLLRKGILKDDELTQADQALKAELARERMASMKSKDVVQKTELQLKAALENLQFTTELTLQDYFAVYLSRYKDQPEAIGAAAAKLSKEEILELLKVMMKSSPGEIQQSLDNASQPRASNMDNRSARAL